MKAYKIYSRTEKYYFEIVFANTPGQARSMGLTSDATEGCEFTDIGVRRVPSLDKCYKGKPRMEWYDDDDRIAMVRFEGYRCEDGCDELEKCPAHEWCDTFKEIMDTSCKFCKHEVRCSLDDNFPCHFEKKDTGAQHG